MSVHFRTPRKPATTANALRQGLPNGNTTRVRHFSGALALSRDARAHRGVVIETTRTPMCLTKCQARNCHFVSRPAGIRILCVALPGSVHAYRD